MSRNDLESDPIHDEEILYRRIPVSMKWYTPDENPPLSPYAFRPTKRDVTGLSVYRQKYKNIAEAALGRPGKSYYVAVFKAADLRAKGIDIVPRVIEGDPGHAEIISLTYESRKSNASAAIQYLLASELCLAIEGPFDTPAAEFLDDTR